VFRPAFFRKHCPVPARKPKSSPQRTRFGKNAVRLRTRRKLTQEELAERIGLSSRYLQSIEAGEYFPSLPTLARLKSALRCGWGELFAGCDKA
jgi:DNA-binding XRE family transcriptional regulator